LKKVVLPETLVRRLQTIYEGLEQEYQGVAQQLRFSCTGCPDNCCDSYFLHHTYVEWAYLWVGFKKLELAKQKKLLQKSEDNIKKCNIAQNRDEYPQVMCPLNEEGLCVLYKYRLLICRTHGVPAVMIRPDGKKMQFPGCFRCQDIVKRKYGNIQPPHVQRTPFLRQLVSLESELLENRRHLMPKVRMTIAEMLVKGAPVIPVPFCEKKPEWQ